jgi:CO dehydrogenase/acetyl-CoA synthase beta subunit
MARDKSRGQKWDGKSRVSNDLYRKNFNEIFKKTDDPFKKEQDELKESFEQSKKAKKEREKILKEISDRNGF